MCHVIRYCKNQVLASLISSKTHINRPKIAITSPCGDPSRGVKNKLKLAGGGAQAFRGTFHAGHLQVNSFLVATQFNCL